MKVWEEVFDEEVEREFQERDLVEACEVFFKGEYCILDIGDDWDQYIVVLSVDKNKKLEYINKHNDSLPYIQTFVKKEI